MNYKKSFFASFHLISTLNARSFWHVSRLIALPLHLHQYSSFSCPETEKQPFLHHLPFFYYVQSPETKSLLNFIFITFLFFFSIVFYGVFTAHATIRPVFHHSLPGRLTTYSPAKLKEPSKSFQFLLEWIIAFAIVCEKNDHRYPIFSFLWAREQSTNNAEEYWTGSRKNREVPAGQIDVNNKHHKSKLGFIKHFVKVRQVSQWNCFVENSRNMKNAEKAHKGKLYTTVWFVFALLVCLILYTSWTLDDCPEKWCICGLRHSSTKV